MSHAMMTLQVTALDIDAFSCEAQSGVGYSAVSTQVASGPWYALRWPGKYRVDSHLVDLGFVCFLLTYCFVGHILLEQVGIGQNGQITLAAMAEKTNRSQQRIVYD